MEIGQNTEKNPEDLRRLAVTKTAAKNSQGVNNNKDEKINYIINECTNLAENIIKLDPIKLSKRKL